MKIKVLFSFLLVFTSISLFAQAQHSTEIGVQTDNDSYLLQGSDRYYTDGFYAYYRHALSTDGNNNLKNKILGFEFGQKIFNPQAGSVADFYGKDQAYLVDRPFAAYLYVGSTLNFLYSNESNLKLSAQVGVVGPDAYGKQVQDWVHSTFGFYHPSGWEYQIKNDPEINLSAEYNRLLARTTGVDISFSSYGNLGNGFTGAGLGFLLRLGNFNQLFNSVSTQSTASVGNKITPLHKHELFFYYKPLINYVAYDATIQGGLLETHHQAGSQEITLDKEPFIFSNQLGVDFTTNRFTFDIAAIVRTRDTKEMIRSTHQWGAITGMYRFK
jgi:lipid A 3-O-deacylase